jgi:hypothetical protein
MFPYEIETAPRNVKKKKRSGVAGFTVAAIDLFYESSEVAFRRYSVIFTTDYQLKGQSQLTRSKHIRSGLLSIYITRPD